MSNDKPEIKSKWNILLSNEKEADDLNEDSNKNLNDDDLNRLNKQELFNQFTQEHTQKKINAHDKHLESMKTEGNIEASTKVSKSMQNAEMVTRDNIASTADSIYSQEVTGNVQEHTPNDKKETILTKHSLFKPESKMRAGGVAVTVQEHTRNNNKKDEVLPYPKKEEESLNPIGEEGEQDPKKKDNSGNLQLW